MTSNIGILMKLLASKGKSVRPLFPMLIVSSFGMVPKDEVFICKEPVLFFVPESQVTKKGEILHSLIFWFVVY